MEKNIYKTLNLLFIRISTNNTFIETAKTKYMTFALDGGVFPDEIYTEEEIKAKYPEIKGYNSFDLVIK